MGKQGSCKICLFFRKAPYYEDVFKKEVAEGSSLRNLQSFLKGQGLEVSLKTISSHFRHMNAQVMAIIKHETSLRQKVKKKLDAVPKFFTKTPKVPITSECEHKATERRFNMFTEKIEEYCLSCGELVGSYSIERAETQSRYKNQRIYKSLMRRRRK